MFEMTKFKKMKIFSLAIRIDADSFRMKLADLEKILVMLPRTPPLRLAGDVFSQIGWVFLRRYRIREAKPLLAKPLKYTSNEYFFKYYIIMIQIYLKALEHLL